MTEFDAAFQARLSELIAWRRDVRRFEATPLPPGTLDRLIAAACRAPSVGLSQPWRFVTVDDPARRAAIVAEFTRANADALAAQLAALPQTCLRQDRLSALEQWSLDEQSALGSELEHGLVSLAADALSGAARFAEGEGRHGS